MLGYEKFIIRVDGTAIKDIPVTELRTRLDLLEAELSQLTHDEDHVKTDCYGMELFHHLRKIEKERSAALVKKGRYTTELSERGES